MIYFGLALLYFLPAFLPGQHIFGTDYLVGGYFFHEFISERFAAGELPKWVPYVYGGLPLFANPGSTYYPFRFLADFLFPVSKIWPTLFIIQFGFAGLGMYLLARELGTRRWVALVSGLAFEFTGITMSWVYAGHEGRIIVATFTPLVFYFFHRGIRTARFAFFVGAAATLGFALLSFQIQNCYYLLMAAALWSAFCLWHLDAWRPGNILVRRLALGLGAVAFAFSLAAVNFLPFLDYVAQSPRGEEGGRGYEYSVSFSMPPADILGMAVPEHQGVSVSDPVDGQALFPPYRGENPFKLHTEYVGALVVLLIALGAYYSRRNRYWWFFVGLALFALSIAFGGNTPLYRIYYELLPGTDKFRAPDLAFFLVAFSVVTMAALTLERVAEIRDGTRDRRSSDSADRIAMARLPWIVAAVVGVAVVGTALSSGAAQVPADGPTAAGGWLRFALFAALVGGLLSFWALGKMTTSIAALLLAVATVADLWIIDRKFFHTVPPPEVTFAADDVVEFMLSQPGRDRVWVLPAGRVYRGQPGNYLMHFDIDQAGGEHGNQLQRWNEYVGAGEQTYVDWHNFIQHTVFLNAANIRYIITGMEIQSPLLRELYRGSSLVYENLSALPRVYLVPRVVTTETPDGALDLMKQEGFDPRETAVVNTSEALRLPDSPLDGSAELVEYQPDRLTVRTRQNRRALLVIADNFYQGWEAVVDGQVVPIFRTNHTLRGIVLEPGDHEVVLQYKPEDLYRGFVIYLIGLTALLVYGIAILLEALRRRRSARLA